MATNKAPKGFVIDEAAFQTWWKSNRSAGRYQTITEALGRDLYIAGLQAGAAAADKTTEQDRRWANCLTLKCYQYLSEADARAIIDSGYTAAKPASPAPGLRAAKAKNP